MTKQEVTLRVVALVVLILVYSIPYDLATWYVVRNLTGNPVWDNAEVIPTILLGLSQRQQVLLDLLQKLLIPLVVVLSVLWLGNDADGSAGGVKPNNRLIGFRYVLGTLCLVLFVTVVADYVIVDNLSNYKENDLLADKEAVLSYLSGGIESSLTIFALLVGVSVK